MNLVFMGTPEFAVPSLQILAGYHRVQAVVTQPDRRQGRGQRISQSPVKRCAVQLQIPVFQPERIGDAQAIAQLAELSPQVIVVVAFGQKIPNVILSLPPYGCINLHASLLPRYRGAAPIHWAIVNGDSSTGVTTMYMNETWDAGDLLLQETEEIRRHDTAGTLHDRLAVKGAELLKRSLDALEAQTAPRIPQEQSEATFAPKLQRKNGLISWDESAPFIERFVRGMNPWPAAYSYFQGVLIKVLRAQCLDDKEQYAAPGEIINIGRQGIDVATGQGVVRLDLVQRENGARTTGRELANGLRLQVGARFSQTEKTDETKK